METSQKENSAPKKKSHPPAQEIEIDDDNNNDDDDDILSEPVPAKKKAKFDPDGVSVAAYINVRIPPAVPARMGQKQKVTDTIVQRGPFFFDISESYTGFLDQVAATTPCTLSALVTSKIQWKFESPKTAEPKPLGDENGYKAMITSLKQRNKGHVVMIFMPEPKQAEVVSDTAITCLSLLKSRASSLGRPVIQASTVQNLLSRMMIWRISRLFRIKRFV